MEVCDTTQDSLTSRRKSIDNLSSLTENFQLGQLDTFLFGVNSLRQPCLIPTKGETRGRTKKPCYAGIKLVKYKYGLLVGILTTTGQVRQYMIHFQTVLTPCSLLVTPYTLRPVSSRVS